MKTFPVIYLCYCSTWRHNIFLARFFTGGYEKHKKELLRIRHAKTDFFSDNVNSSNIFLLDGNPKLFNTMTITNLAIEDDSRYGNIGSYECHELRFLISTKKKCFKDWHDFNIWTKGVNEKEGGWLNRVTIVSWPVLGPRTQRRVPSTW